MAGAETSSGEMVAQSRLKYEVEREEAARGPICRPSIRHCSLLAETVFKRIYVQKGRVVRYELTPLFVMFFASNNTTGSFNSSPEPVLLLDSSLPHRCGFEVPRGLTLSHSVK